MNDKDNNYVLKLSHVILSKIIGFLNKNIDKICFSLVCKQLYQQRDKYIFLNCDNIPQRYSNSIDNEYPRFQLNSYKNLLKRALELKSNCSLLITYTDQPDEKNNYDYIIVISDFKELEIPSTVKKLEFHYLFPHDLDSKFKSKLERSNVNQITLDSRRILFDRFPSNIKDSLLVDSNQTLQLEIQSLPPNLQELRCVSTFILHCTLRSLPSTLRKLSISFQSLKSSIRENLPASLTELSVVFSNDDVIDCNNYIPLHISKLILITSKQHLTKGFIPSGVRKLEISRSVSLEIDIFSELNRLETLDLSRISSYEGRIGRLPSNLKRMALLGCKYDPDIFIFPENRLDYLQIGDFSKTIRSDMLPLCKELVCSFGCDIESLPDGVETLALLSYHLFQWKDLPSSLRTLTITKKTLQMIGGAEGIPSNITNIRLLQSVNRNKYFLRRLNDQQFLLCGSAKYQTNGSGAIINQSDLLDFSLKIK
ncbi:hypothetical protein PPL_08248 [Heterostelium album PN500]|uniref:F-box domain-containing protein n=1 Tax=Heterostelium pallidum (strain ATCC 26659 / Pp 5 / PN500) TaxID=670386 RepID=D3BJ11_HETP5|nr:hypothetical protein PPL_08248 [Heterostelium album PN500]EFA78785.1 hypothetical protein PPL_08248 [Heterostelium album PN500]|eukprot:XP_020430909.1 hypothetical protein PPL_08248 [Heterostelium album PN500]